MNSKMFGILLIIANLHEHSYMLNWFLVFFNCFYNEWVPGSAQLILQGYRSAKLQGFAMRPIVLTWIWQSYGKAQNFTTCWYIFPYLLKTKII